MEGKLKAGDIDVLKGVLDAVIDEYSENNKVIFANESERARNHFGTIKRGVERWAKSKRCMVPNCKNRSIKRSHTVPRGMSLTLIGENGHVLTPEFNREIGAIWLENTGLSNATTFPGFCNEHEQLFKEFENKKSIDTEDHISLQAYRAACREFFRIQFVIEQHDWTRVRPETDTPVQ